MGCVFALHGITLALFDRMTTGEGQYIDVSIHDACSIGTESAVPEWLYNGATLYRQTGMHASARRRPDLELPTADGMYVIAVNQTFGDRGWAKLIEWMEEKGVAGELTDPKYRDEAVRMADYRQGTAVLDGIRRLIAACKGEEVFTRAQSYGISWGLVRAPEENYDVAHYQQRDFWRNVEHPEIRRAIPYPRGPFMCDALGIAPRGRAPHLGEHTRLVLEGDLGLPAAQVDALAAAGVVR
jgi:crotonobetainyl-CoA:carnitine CoA-transferase CaiB-like acyl-CoA transferase